MFWANRSTYECGQCISGLGVGIVEPAGTKQKEHRRMARKDAVTLQEEQKVLLAEQGPPDPWRIPQGLNFSVDKMGRDRGGVKG